MVTALFHPQSSWEFEMSSLFNVWHKETETGTPPSTERITPSDITFLSP